MSKKATLPYDVRLECIAYVRGYPRRVRAYREARAEILGGTHSATEGMPTGSVAGRPAESKAEQLKLLLGNILGGGKFETPKIAMFYRRSKAVECDDDFISWAQENADELLTYKPPVPNKAAIKDAILSGMDVKYAGITERNNLVIK